MSGYRALSLGLVLLACVLVLFALLPEGKQGSTGKSVLDGESRKGGREIRATPRDGVAGRSRELSAFREPKSGAQDGVRLEQGEHGGGVDKATDTAEGDKDGAANEKRQRCVSGWDSLVDQIAKDVEPPTEERLQGVKKAFDELDRQDQMDGIRRSLNLLPDEQFASLYGILFDKKEDPEVLDAIFSDALNRTEEIKIPLMKSLAKDKEHPCFFESARILDVIGKLNEVEADKVAAP